jgi:hypothetical protein
VALQIYRKLDHTCEFPHCTFHMQVDGVSYSVPAWTAPPDAAQSTFRKSIQGKAAFSRQVRNFGEQVWQVHTVNVNGKARWRLY